MTSGWLVSSFPYRRMPPKTPDYEWLRQKLSTLTEYADEIYGVAPGAVNEIGPWAALKLFQLIVTVDLYTRIIERTDGIDRKFYFDVLAGSGVVSLEGQETNIMGSPLIAATLPEHAFDELYFFEGKPERTAALSDRLDFVADETPLELDRDRCHVIQGDANETVPETITQLCQSGLHRHTNQFSFVDNERMQIKWATMVELSRIWGDFLINFQHKGIARELGYLESDETPKARVETAQECLREFVGGEQYRDCDNVAELKDLYKGQLAEIGEEYGKPANNRPVQEEIRVDGVGGKYSYDLIYATRKTNNESPYVEFMENMKSRIEPMSGDDVSQVINIMEGAATGLDEFAPSTKDIEHDEDQTSLGDF